MAKYSPKNARERAERVETSWKENAPDKKWSEGSLDAFKTKRQTALDVESDLTASEARTKALMIQRDDLYEDLMQECDYIVADVEGDRNFGPDSALYAGFGYIRKSEKKKGGNKKKKP
jgi:nucleoside 2-deoxyribosyltransferase